MEAKNAMKSLIKLATAIPFIAVGLAGCTDSAQLEISKVQSLSTDAVETGKKFYQTLDVPPAPSLSPAQALAAFSIAPDFKIELVAAEPMVEDPVAMAWDENGDLYVVEMRGFMPDAYGNGADQPVGRVVKLRDNDNDGVMDESRVFLDDLVLPRAVAIVNEGVLIGEPPTLWLCKNNHPETGCGEKVRVGGYAHQVNEANVEHMENGLLMGLDNWLYNAKSARRIRLNNGQLEEQNLHARGQWGIAKDNQGRLFYNTNSNYLSADLFPGEHFIGERGISGLNERLTEQDEVFSVRVNPGVNRSYIDGILREDGRLKAPTAVSGLAVYTGDQFPAEYQRDVFVPEPGANVVAQLRLHGDDIKLQAEHITYPDAQWGQREFLASTDERFRPVDAKIGPDGALYIIDMYRGIIQETAFLTDELREQIFDRKLDRPLGNGRIWRISHREGNNQHLSLNLAAASNQQLVTLLGHANSWHRDTAQRLLIGRGKVAVGLFEQQISKGSVLAASHALWTLEGRQQLSAKQLLAAINRNNTTLSLQALRAGGQLLSEQQLLAIIDSHKPLTAALQQQLLFDLARHNDQPNIQQTFMSLLNLSVDSRYIQQALAKAIQGQEFAFLQLLLNNDNWQNSSPARTEFLTLLTAKAYQQLRGDLTSNAPAPEALQQLTELIANNRGPLAWRQAAMFDGLFKVTRQANFSPAQMAKAPTLFTETSDVDQPALNEKRLQGRRAFTWPGDERASGATPLTPAQLALKAEGEKLFSGCSNCHGQDGLGVVGLAPALADSPWVTGPPEWLGRIILQGMQGPVVIHGVEWNGVMPPHQALPGFDDRGLAGLMTYLRRSWGNSADPVSVEQVSAIRAASSDQTAPWTVAELEKVPFESDLQRFVGDYKLSFVTINISLAGDQLAMKIPMYGESKLQLVNDMTFSGGDASNSIDLRFVEGDDGNINAFILLRDGQEMTAEKIQ